MLEPPGSGDAYAQLTDEELNQEICMLLESAGMVLAPAHQISSQKLLAQHSPTDFST